MNLESILQHETKQTLIDRKELKVKAKVHILLRKILKSQILNE